MKIFSLCLFSLIFDLSNQILKNNKLRNLDDEKNIIELEISPYGHYELDFINNTFESVIEKIYVNGTEMTEKILSVSVNDNGNFNVTIQFQNNFEGSCAYMFSYIDIIKKIKFKNFNGCNNTEQMFSRCSSLESLDLSSFDASKVTNMGGMFMECSLLESLDISSFDTSKVTNMGAMFYGCSSLESLDFSSFDTSKVTGMSSMFRDCFSLESLNLSSFNTLSVTGMRSMFLNCYSLYELILSSSFTMENVDNDDLFFSNYYFSFTQKGAKLMTDINDYIDSSRDLKKKLNFNYY